MYIDWDLPFTGSLQSIGGLIDFSVSSFKSEGSESMLVFDADNKNGRSCGANILFKDAHKKNGWVVDCVERLSEILSGSKSGTAILSDPVVFLQSCGAGLEVHCDPHCVISIQLYGAKTWRLYSAELVPGRIRYLRSKYRVEGGGEEVSDFYSGLSLPSPEVYKLNQGDFIYVPRYWLHETVAETSSFSMSAVVSVN